jgi:hypothetical protein
VPREASIQRAVNRTAASVKKAAAAQRIQLMGPSSESHLSLLGFAERTRGWRPFAYRTVIR